MMMQTLPAKKWEEYLPWPRQRIPVSGECRSGMRPAAEKPPASWLPTCVKGNLSGVQKGVWRTIGVATRGEYPVPERTANSRAGTGLLFLCRGGLTFFSPNGTLETFPGKAPKEKGALREKGSPAAEKARHWNGVFDRDLQEKGTVQ